MRVNAVIVYFVSMWCPTEDVLVEDKEECIICLDELRQGDTIARLPCLCIYHKRYFFLLSSSFVFSVT